MQPKDKDIILSVSNQVKKLSEGDSGGHDWWHIYRVWQVARGIAEIEKGDLLVIELAALLHDIGDWKFNNGDELAGGKMSRSMLEEYALPKQTVNHIVDIVDTLSFKGAKVDTSMKSLEGKIVQDADRLDAIGAIGIARAFAYGGMKGRSIYDPNIEPFLHSTFESYKSSNSTTINHFFEKLLLLKDRMNTQTAKEIATNRQKFMEQFIFQFFKEWDFDMEKFRENKKS